MVPGLASTFARCLLARSERVGQSSVYWDRPAAGRIIRQPQATMPLSPGTRLGSYQVTALIGQGGMGEVYQGSERNTSTI